METSYSPLSEVHPLVFFGTLLYALAVVGLLFVYVQWVFGPIAG